MKFTFIFILMLISIGFVLVYHNLLLLSGWSEHSLPTIENIRTAAEDGEKQIESAEEQQPEPKLEVEHKGVTFSTSQYDEEKRVEYTSEAEEDGGVNLQLAAPDSPNGMFVINDVEPLVWSPLLFPANFSDLDTKDAKDSEFRRLLQSVGRDLETDSITQRITPVWSGRGFQDFPCSLPTWQSSTQKHQYEVILDTMSDKAVSNSWNEATKKNKKEEWTLTIQVISKDTDKGFAALDMTLSSILDVNFSHKGNRAALQVVICTVEGGGGSGGTAAAQRVARRLRRDWRYGPVEVLRAPAPGQAGWAAARAWAPRGGGHEHLLTLGAGARVARQLALWVVNMVRTYHRGPAHGERAQIMGIANVPNLAFGPDDVGMFKGFGVHFSGHPPPAVAGTLFFGGEWADFLAYAQAYKNPERYMQSYNELLQDFMIGRGFVLLYPVMDDGSGKRWENYYYKSFIVPDQKHVDMNREWGQNAEKLVMITEKDVENLMKIKLPSDVTVITTLDAHNRRRSLAHQLRLGLRLAEEAAGALPDGAEEGGGAEGTRAAAAAAAAALRTTPLPGCALRPALGPAPAAAAAAGGGPSPPACPVQAVPALLQRQWRGGGGSRGGGGYLAYLVYQPFGGLSNQMMSLHAAMELAFLLDRVLVVPHILTENGQGPPIPWSATQNFDALIAAAPAGAIINMDEFLTLNLRPERIYEISISARHVEQNLKYFTQLGWGDVPVERMPDVTFSPAAWHRRAGACGAQVLALSSLFNAYSHAERRKLWRADAVEKEWSRGLQRAARAVHPGIDRAVGQAFESLKEKANGILNHIACMHVRRGDFEGYCQDLKKEANSKNARPAMRRLIKTSNLCFVQKQHVFKTLDKVQWPRQEGGQLLNGSSEVFPIYMATDDLKFAKDPDFSRSYSIFTLIDLLPSAKNGGIQKTSGKDYIPDIWLPIVDQHICARARLLVLNAFSTYSDSIKLIAETQDQEDEVQSPKKKILNWQK